MDFEDGEVINEERLIKKRIEEEIEFKMKEKMKGKKVQVLDVLKEKEYIKNEMEIIDKRILRVENEKKKKRRIVEKI